ncbi:hypothetical protein B0H34DRAFT_24767 [Crassisporium funariophilum]|nr:hypothetical protein B0H34DRAFT_24767 [Crassisporium funariophilum]
MLSQGDQQVLRRTAREILSIVEKVKAITQTRQIRTTTLSPAELSHIKIPSLEYPSHDDLGHFFKALNLAEQQSHQLSSKVHECMRNMRIKHTRKFETLCRELLSKPHYDHRHPITVILKDLRDTYQMTIDDQFSYIKAQIVTWGSRHVNFRAKRRTPFNNEYTPFLEEYFEKNAYPSAPDRLILARKSMMTPRQIEVWFQNHRKRAKEQGKSLKRLSSDRPPHLSLKLFEERKPFNAVPERNKLGSPDDESSDEDTEDEFSTVSILNTSTSPS